MAKKKQALGRALGAIISEVGESYEQNLGDNSSLVLELNIDIIKPNPYQPRKFFNQEALKELADSIREHGLLQPVVVYDNGDGDYILIAGERRLRASKIAGLGSIKAVVADIDIKHIRELALIENIQREELNPIELANAYKELIDEYDMTHEELSLRISKSRAQITNTLRLLQLSDIVQAMLIEEKITQGHAKMLASLEPKEQKLVADSIIGQKLNVSDTELLIKKLKKDDGAISPKTIRKHTSSFIKIDSKLLGALQKELKTLGIYAQIHAEKLSISFQNDTQIATLIEKISK